MPTPPSPINTGHDLLITPLAGTVDLSGGPLDTLPLVDDTQSQTSSQDVAPNANPESDPQSPPSPVSPPQDAPTLIINPND